MKLGIWKLACRLPIHNIPYYVIVTDRSFAESCEVPAGPAKRSGGQEGLKEDFDEVVLVVLVLVVRCWWFCSGTPFEAKCRGSGPYFICRPGRTMRAQSAVRSAAMGSNEAQAMQSMNVSCSVPNI